MPRLVRTMASIPSPLRLVYTSHPSWPLPSSASPSTLRISILDSSFNPAHCAHLSLASHPPHSDPQAAYDAHLLLLGTKNADKESKPGEETVRLEMMRVLAEEMEGSVVGDDAGRGVGNVAVGLLSDCPTFVGKSRVLQRELVERMRGSTAGTQPAVRLTFSMGWDTITRFFDDKYYQPPNPSIRDALASFFVQDGSSITCARRGDVGREAEEAFLAGENVREWRDKIEMIDLEGSVGEISSTLIRSKVREGQGLDGLVLKGVEAIIAREGLYR